MTVDLLEAESTRCFQLLGAGEIDLVVVVPLPDTPPRDDPRFDQQPLLDDPQDLVVAPDHPLAGHADVELAEAATESWIAAPAAIDQHQLIFAACAAAGFTPRVTHQAQEWNAICALVAHGFGVCLIPRLAPLPPIHPVVRVPLRGQPTPARRLLTCLRRGSGDQPAIASALETLRGAVDALDPPAPRPS